MARKFTILLLIAVCIYEALLALTIRADWAKSTHRQFLEVGTQNAELGAQTVRYVLDRAVANGVFKLEEVLDKNYTPIPASTPPQFRSSYDFYFDRNVREMQDGFLRASAIKYAYAMTKDGYVPTSSNNALNKTRRGEDLPSGQVNETIERLRAREDGVEYYEYAAPIKLNDQLWGEFRVGIPKEYVAQEVDSKVRNTILLTIVVTVFMVVLAYFGINRATRPIAHLSSLAERVAAGDLGAAPTEREARVAKGWHKWIGGEDEVLKLETSFGRMARNLRELIGSVQSATKELSTSTAQIAVTAKQAMTTASQQAVTVQQVGTTVEEIGQTSRVVVERAHDVVGVAEQAVEGGQKGTLSIAEAQRALELIARIIEIVETVNELAEQSNLLAVNASIEASKAGEHGRGFGVVASEVRSLAGQSKKAAKQIREILTRIEASGEAVGAANTAITRLAAVLEDSASKARQIAGAASQQAAGIEQISDAMSNVVEGGRVMAEGARQLEAAVSNLNGLAQRLDATLAAYKT
ncbi:MAG TPA: methyl-accepting chemotaxis protein [Polyangiaceae bacterium]|nr:methyl-accepting chemotaxis protein [Polyangiaceae bacterium]